jgi:crossover junction endodeoxyribonuclease RuvC
VKDIYYLGLDPSTKSTGYAIVNNHGELLDYGKICPTDNKEAVTPAERILQQYQEITELLINKYPIKKVYCEDQYFGANIDTLKQLSRVTGMVLLVSAQYKVPVELIYPSSWRKVFHGSGKAKKSETLRKVNEMFGLELKLAKHNDISDAIGIAMSAYMTDTMGE